MTSLKEKLKAGVTAEMVSTTNRRFAHHTRVGKRTLRFAVSMHIGSLRTSGVKSFSFVKDTGTLTVNTINSIYVFKLFIDLSDVKADSFEWCLSEIERILIGI